MLLTIAYFGAIVIAALVGGTWAGLAVFGVATVIAAFWFFRRTEPQRPEQRTTRRLGADDERRILVIANETVGGGTLRDCIRSRTEGYRSNVLVVSPALNSPLKHWVSDEDGARKQARERLDASLARLRASGVEAEGEIGDGDPLQAMEDALRTFGADEIIISTHPEGRSNWLERGVVPGARERFAVPITHVVVDLAAEPEELR